MTSSATCFHWPAGIRAAISLTFDDARPSQLEHGLPILDRYGVKGSFYVTLPALAQNAAAWRAAAERGHEIGNHTTSHPCTCNFGWNSRQTLEELTLDTIEQDILNASAVITETIGIVPATFAYPCGQTFVGRGRSLQSYIPLVAKHFLAGRGWNCESMVIPGLCDLAYLPGTSMDGASWEQVEGLVTKAAETGRWLVLAGHNVASGQKQGVDPQVLERLLAYAAEPGRGLWVETLANVARYVAAQQQVTDAPVVSNGATAQRAGA